jgi:hypothetical protein
MLPLKTRTNPQSAKKVGRTRAKKIAVVQEYGAWCMSMVHGV